MTRPVPLARLREEDFGTYEHEFDQRDAALYALGIGEHCALHAAAIKVTSSATCVGS